MRIDLPCAIVRDLLPSYVEGLTEAETTAAVKEHLETCESCRSRYETMSDGEAVPTAEPKEVDYLKTVRNKNRKMVILSVVLAVVLLLSCVGAKLFLIGSPANFESVAVSIVPTQDNVKVSLDNMDSAMALIGVKANTNGETIEITARKALVSPFHRGGSNVLSLDMDGIREIRAFGETIWQDGVVIDTMTRRLMACKTPYVGSAPAVGKILSGMDLDVPVKMELQTAKEPYGLTLHAMDTIAENRRFLMEGNAYVLLALVDNLGEVYWDDPSGYTDSLTLKDADAALPGLVEAYNQSHGTDIAPLASVKDYAADSYHLQLLRNILDL